MLVLLPRSIGDAITASGSPWGTLDLKQAEADNLIVVDGWRKRQEYGGKAIDDHHYTRYMSAVPGSAVWYEVEPTFHELGRYRALRGGGVTKEEFKGGVLGGWRKPAKGATYILTFSRRAGNLRPYWHAWLLGDDAAIQLPLDFFDSSEDLLAPLDKGWPLDRLSDTHVTVVGVGSVRSVAAEALASYGIRKFSLHRSGSPTRSQLCSSPGIEGRTWTAEGQRCCRSPDESRSSG